MNRHERRKQEAQWRKQNKVKVPKGYPGTNVRTQEEWESYEPLTEALIAELVGRGWDEETLLFDVSQGGRYCRERDSVELRVGGWMRGWERE